jgi:hypothetical protein
LLAVLAAAGSGGTTRAAHLSLPPTLEVFGQLARLFIFDERPEHPNHIAAVCFIE